jgi:hypothetical protein
MLARLTGNQAEMGLEAVLTVGIRVGSTGGQEGFPAVGRGRKTILTVFEGGLSTPVGPRSIKRFIKQFDFWPCL